MNKMKPFTKYDWYELAGAERFPDGSEPLVGRYGKMIVVVDRNGLQAWLEEMENNVLCIEANPCFRDITLGTANLLLERAEVMSEQELTECFKKLGGGMT